MEKKLTPLQEAVNKEKSMIAELEGQLKISISVNGMFDKIHIQILLKHHKESFEFLTGLLPKEKEFARDMFEAGGKRKVHEGATYPDAFNFTITEKTTPKFDDLYKQYEQS